MGVIPAETDQSGSSPASFNRAEEAGQWVDRGNGAAETSGRREENPQGKHIRSSSWKPLSCCSYEKQ